MDMRNMRFVTTYNKKPYLSGKLARKGGIV